MCLSPKRGRGPELDVWGGMLEESIAGDRRNSPDDDSMVMVAAGPVADAAEIPALAPSSLVCARSTRTNVTSPLYRLSFIVCNVRGSPRTPTLWARVSCRHHFLPPMTFHSNARVLRVVEPKYLPRIFLSPFPSIYDGVLAFFSQAV
jgi:hypothetical protein